MADSDRLQGDEERPPNVWEFRLRRALDRQFVVVVAALLITAALGGYLAYEPHVEPGVEIEEETVTDWSERTAFGHSATVQQSNPVFPVGSELTDRSLYYTTLAPELDGTYEYQYSGNGGDGTVDVEMDVQLRYRSVAGDDDGVFWERSEPITTVEREGVDPGDPITAEFQVNVSEAESQVDSIQEQLGTTIGTTEVDVVVHTQVQGTVDGEEVASTHRQALQISPDGSTYSVEDPGTETELHESTVTHEVPAEYGPLRSYGYLALVAVSLLGLVGLGTARHRGKIAPSKREERAVEWARTRSEFDEWISRGRVPADSIESTRIELESLDGLVDVAIDSNRRVIEDVTRNAFYVLGEDAHYVFVSEPVDLDEPLSLENSTAVFSDRFTVDTDTDTVTDSDSDFDSRDSDSEEPDVSDAEPETADQPAWHSGDDLSRPTKQDTGENPERGDGTAETVGSRPDDE